MAAASTIGRDIEKGEGILRDRVSFVNSNSDTEDRNVELQDCSPKVYRESITTADTAIENENTYPEKNKKDPLHSPWTKWIAYIFLVSVECALDINITKFNTVSGKCKTQNLHSNYFLFWRF